jgi:cytochrome c556
LKGWRFLKNGIFGLCFIGLVSSTHYSVVHAAEEWIPAHEKVMEPTKVLMNEIAGHINNMLNGLLTGNYKSIVQEAGAIVNKSYKVNEVFFPTDPKENEWFKRAKIDPNDSEKITKLKEEFTVYLKEIASSALEVQKAASSYDEQTTFKSFTKMIEKSCFECHKQLRDKQIPIENR